MKRTFWLLALLLLLCPCVQAQESWQDYHSWQVTFYELDSTVSVGMDTFRQGQTMEISWTQPLTSTPLDQQPEPIKYANTGQFINIPVLRQNVTRFDTSGAVYETEVNLTVGKWAIGVKAVLNQTYGDGSNIVSKQSNWFAFYVGAPTDIPPGVPVSIGIRLRQN